MAAQLEPPAPSGSPVAKVEEAPSSAPPPPPPPVGSAAIAGEVPTDVPPPPPPPPPLGGVHDPPKPPVVLDGGERVPVAHGGYKRRRVGEAEASWQYMYLCEHDHKVRSDMYTCSMHQDFIGCAQS